MYHVRRHFVRSTSPAAPFGRRTHTRWAATVVLAVACTASLTFLFTSNASGSTPEPGDTSGGLISGTAAGEVPSPSPTAPTAEDPSASLTAIPEPTPDPGVGPSNSSNAGELRNPAPAPTGTPSAPAGAGAMSTPPNRLGFKLGLDDALRAPDAGSQPSMAPTAKPADVPTPAPVAEQTTDRWSFLHRSATGQWLFLIGFLLLLLSISGLVTVGFYRRRW
jgi:hypothetical protein